MFGREPTVDQLNFINEFMFKAFLKNKYYCFTFKKFLIIHVYFLHIFYLQLAYSILYDVNIKLTRKLNGNKNSSVSMIIISYWFFTFYLVVKEKTHFTKYFVAYISQTKMSCNFYVYIHVSLMFAKIEAVLFSQ